MIAMYVSVRDLLSLDVLVQFLLPVLQAHCDIGRAFAPPKEIEVITKTLALIKRGDGAVESVLSLKSDGSVLQRGRFLVWRI